MTKQPVQAGGFRHEAFFYADSDEFLAGAVPFLEEGLSAGEAVLAVLPEPRRRLLRGALGPAAGEVEFEAMEEVGRNPGRLISTWRDVLQAGAPNRGARGLGEPAWAGRSPAELEECERHERLLNLAFAQETALTFLCPYDTSALDDEVLAAAQRSHSHCSGPQGRTTSSQFEPGASLEGSLPEPTGVVATLSFGKANLRTVRRLVFECARSAGLDLHRCQDLVLAASEIAANSVLHGGGGGGVRIWKEAGALHCDVRDTGRIDDPLAGRERPRPGQAGGRGLWVANQLCDLVQIRSGEQGNQVRLRMSLS